MPIKASVPPVDVLVHSSPLMSPSLSTANSLIKITGVVGQKRGFQTHNQSEVNDSQGKNVAQTLTPCSKRRTTLTKGSSTSKMKQWTL